MAYISPEATIEEITVMVYEAGSMGYVHLSTPDAMLQAWRLGYIRQSSHQGFVVHITPSGTEHALDFIRKGVKPPKTYTGGEEAAYFNHLDEFNARKEKERQRRQRLDRYFGWLWFR